MRREKYASCDESPLNTAFRAFVISRCATDTHDTHTARPLDSQKCTKCTSIYTEIEQ